MIRVEIFRHRVEQEESRLSQRLANVLHRCDEKDFQVNKNKKRSDN